LRPLTLGQQARQDAGVVGGDLGAAGGVRVHGEVDHGGDRPALWRVEGEYADLRVDGAGGPDDLRAALGRVPADGAVAHVEAAVEAQVLLAPGCGGGPDG